MSTVRSREIAVFDAHWSEPGSTCVARTSLAGYMYKIDHVGNIWNICATGFESFQLKGRANIRFQ